MDRNPEYLQRTESSLDRKLSEFNLRNAKYRNKSIGFNAKETDAITKEMERHQAPPKPRVDDEFEREYSYRAPANNDFSLSRTNPIDLGHSSQGKEPSIGDYRERIR